MSHYYFIHQQQMNSLVSAVTEQTVTDWVKFSSSIRQGYDTVREKNVALKKMQKNYISATAPKGCSRPDDMLDGGVYFDKDYVPARKLPQNFPKDKDYQTQAHELSGLPQGMTLQVMKVRPVSDDGLEGGYLVNIKNNGYASEEKRKSIHKLLSKKSVSEFKVKKNQVMVFRDEGILAAAAYAADNPPPVYQPVIVETPSVFFQPLQDTITVLGAREQQIFKERSAKRYGPEPDYDMPRRKNVAVPQQIDNLKAGAEERLFRRHFNAGSLYLFDNIPQQLPQDIEIDPGECRKRKPKENSRNVTDHLFAAALLYRTAEDSKKHAFHLCELATTITTNKAMQSSYKAALINIAKKAEYFDKTKEGLFKLKKIPASVVGKLPQIAMGFYGVTDTFREQAQSILDQDTPSPQNITADHQIIPN